MTTLARCCVCSLIMSIYWCSIVSAQVVDIPDLNLESAIREELNLPDATPITQQEMLQLTSLHASKRQIKDLAGLEYVTNLTELSLHQNDISNLKPLADLTQLERLWLWGNPISDLSPLSNLTNLKHLDLGGCQVSDITPLANLSQLTYLTLHYNFRIIDITPLTNLTQLTKLQLSYNQIVDVSPLANLTQLTDLTLANNAITDFRPLLGLNLKSVDIDIHKLQELASIEVEIPDPNLERAIRDERGLADEQPLTQADMLQLTRLEARSSGIKYLTGLEYATNLTEVSLPYNDISDLTLLAELMHLESLWLWGNPISDLSSLTNLTALKRIDLAGCQISNINPLASLTQLTYINLRDNHIVDISALTNLNQLTELRLNSNRIVDVEPLTNLTELTKLHLDDNRIVDVSPLANLRKLERLEINQNLIEDHSPLETLNLTRFVYDQVFELPRSPIQPRIENRTFPSVFSAWGGVLNRPDLSDGQRIALHDFYWSPSFGMHWRKTDKGIQFVGDLNTAQQQRDELVALNPNMLFIIEIRIRDAFVNNFYPEDWPHWIRDENGNLRPGLPGQDYYLIDFTHPELQEQIVEQAITAAQCGLFDGIFFDWWREDGAVLTNHQVGWTELLPGGNEAEQRARDSILQRIRAAVRSDFLIIGNGNRRKFPRTSPYINGTFMETLTDNLGGYTYDGLTEIESTLSWSEENLREPQINCLEGFGIPTEAPDSPTNNRWMRVFTTMSLTHSDGYVLYNTGDTHRHYWYDFWDANLGKPIGQKAQLHQNIEGLFIREFTNGWAVYNRSGAPQTITLPASATPVSDRGNNAASQTHILPDLDGEIYLTTRSFADVNDDGKVNVLDLIQVANGLGKSAPDPNGDGVVNILDLVFITQQFSQ